MGKDVYVLDDEILVEIKSIVRVKIRDLDIHPEFMARDTISNIVGVEFSELIINDESLKPIMHQVKILDECSLTHSVLVSKEEEDKVK